MSKYLKQIAEQPEYIKAVALIKAEDMPQEEQRMVLQLFDQMVARGVTPDKAAYVCGMTFMGRFTRMQGMLS